MARFFSAMLVGAMLCFVFAPAMRSHADAVTETRNDSKVSQQSGTRIALVDMARVFKASKLFNNERETLKDKIADSEKSAVQLNEEIKRLEKKLPNAEQGSDERKEIERKLKASKQEFEKFRQEKSRAFLTEESKIYLSVYEKVQAEVEVYAKAHDIDLVMRTNSEQVNSNMEPNMLLQNMNRQVIYENKLDITDEIIAAVNEQ